jgi:flagellar basal-body rod protein FlgF
MVRGLYTGANGMMVQRHKMDNLTNNIVNAETTGYKKDILVTTPFEEVMLTRINDPSVDSYGETELGNMGYGSYVSEAVIDFTQGSVENTGSVTDLAIMGDGFFTVETASGERYTRDGTFTVSTDGYLSTQDGHYVLGQNGRIYVGVGDFTVREDGTVINSAGDENALKLVTFSDKSVLRKEGGNMLYIFDEAEPLIPENVTVLQGAREGSNVDVTDEMVDMITVYRRYEASQRIVSMTDDSLSLAVNLGRVGG